MTMVKISGCLYYSIYLLCFVMKLAGMICLLDRLLEILQIVQRNLQIGQIGRLDGTCSLLEYLHGSEGLLEAVLQFIVCIKQRPYFHCWLACMV